MLDWVNVAREDAQSRRRAQLMKPSFYSDFLRRRWFLIVAPFVAIAAVGVVMARLMPMSFVSEAKLIVQPQRVSTELVRTTVTGSAQDRLQVIQQRTMTRDRILEMADQYNLFPKARQTMPESDFVELVKKNVKFTVTELTPDFGQRTRGAAPPLVFTVSFEYSDPETAQKVANGLIDRFREEDTRDRRERAASTTKFMVDEYEKLRAENATLDAKIAERRAKLRTVSGVAVDPNAAQLAQLREELGQKSAVYSDQHPLMKSLRRQIQVLQSAKAQEKAADESETASSIEMLNAQQEAANKALEQSAAKLSVAIAGENLERNQQSEKLEVLENATLPQQPTKPNGRLKIIASFVVLGLVAGLVLACIVEALDTGIRSRSDIAIAIDLYEITTIPYIPVRADSRRWSGAMILLAFAFTSAAVAGLLSAPAIGSRVTPIVDQIKANFLK